MSSTASADSVLDVKDLRTYFYTNRGTGKAVDGVSFSLTAGEALGLVGESGSGKSMACLSIMRLNPVPASRVVGGQVLFHGVNLLALSERKMRSYRGKHIGMVLQDPMAALNPVLSIGDQLAMTLRLGADRPLRYRTTERAVELLELMRIPAPKDRLRSYPHQLSGGMRQRVVGAIALSRQPEVLIADEPTTALDATTQAAYLDLLRDLQHRTNVSIIFVTHDFGVVGQICQRVAVMYAGRIVESAETNELLFRAVHPYSRALLRAVPDMNAPPRRLYSIEGQPPSIFSPPAGCRFNPRCELRERLGRPDRCKEDDPELRELTPGHFVACHFAEASGDTVSTGSGHAS